MSTGKKPKENALQRRKINYQGKGKRNFAFPYFRGCERVSTESKSQLGNFQDGGSIPPSSIVNRVFVKLPPSIRQL